MTNDQLLNIINKAAEIDSEELDLSGKNLTELPPEIGTLTKLKKLNLCSNQLRFLPSTVSLLSSLKYLYIRNNKLNSLPPEFFEISSLEILDLSNNELNSLPPKIIQLSSLEILDLSQNKINNLPSEIFKLSSLISLNVSGNNLTNLPSEISQLSSLQYLYFHNNRLKLLSPVIYQLSSLITLDLSNNDLISLSPRISQLSSLQYLDLSNNKLKNLPADISKLSSLQSISLDKNPLNKTSIEIMNQSADSIRDYFRQQKEEGKDILYEAKLIIVGEGGSGKTTLAKKILNPHYQVPTPENSTQGIDILQWNFTQENKNNFRVNIWDFGGQEIYHATHQFFLTKRSLYILVVDSRKEHAHLDYWFHIIELLSNKSPLVLIKNEVDYRPVNIDERKFKGRFQNIKDSLKINLAYVSGIKDIHKSIKHHITSLPHIGSPVPKTWTKVREKLETDGRNYISKEEYLTICHNNGIKQEKDSLQLSQFLHDIGVILHFQNNLILSEIVILQPEWGTDAVYQVLDNTTVQQNLGKFTNTDLYEIWSNPKYSQMVPKLLELMMKFKLCYKIPGSDDTYIAPQLLDYNQPKYNWDGKNNLLLRYKYDFMPKGIFTHFIVEMNRYILGSNVWKNGVLLFKKEIDTYAEIIESNQREIRVRLSGRDNRGFSEIIMDKLDDIHNSYHQLKVDKLVPCNCSVCKTKKEPYFHSLKILRKLRSKGKSCSQCQETGDLIEIHELMNDTFWKKSSNEQIDANNSINITINQGNNRNNPVNQTHSGNGDNVAGGVTNNTFHAPVGAVSSNFHDQSQAIGQYNEAPSQDLAEAAAEIQTLLDQLSQTYPTNTNKEKMIIVGEAVDQIENNPTFKAKVINALKAGGVEAFKEAVDHPLVNILMATIDGWQNT